MPSTDGTWISGWQRQPKRNAGLLPINAVAQDRIGRIEIEGADAGRAIEKARQFIAPAGLESSDFLCANRKFVVEATAFTIDKVVSDSAMPKELPGEIGAHAYRRLTRQISERAGNKNSQLSVGLPAVLAIVCDHVIATLLFDTDAAQFLVTSEPFWIADKEEPTVNLSLSAFLRLEPDGTILPYNRNVSAVILVAVTSEASYLCGALHPHPEH